MNTSSLVEIKKHLKEVSPSFFPPLAERVNIDQYALKIFCNAIRCEAWNENSILIGLIACYANNVENNKEAFVTNVSVFNAYRGNGIAKKLFSILLSLQNIGIFDSIALEVARNNLAAIALYQSIGFYVSQINEEGYIMRLKI